MVHFPCTRALDEPSFTVEERQLVAAFQEEVQRRIETHGPERIEHLTMFSLAQSLSLDLTALPKDSLFMVALWVALLSALSRALPLDSLKYPTFALFHEAYTPRFDHEAVEEQERLWHCANWFHELFRFIAAKKNKGLAMQVVPKLVEGWDAKYVTGSGQTRLTAHRVALFEREGEVKACHRGRARGHAHGNGSAAKRHCASSGASSLSAKERDLFRPKKRRRRSSSSLCARKQEREEDEREWVYNNPRTAESDREDDEDDERERFRERESFEDDDEDLLDVGEYFYSDTEVSPQRDSERDREAHTDADEDSVHNEEVKKAFISFIDKPTLQRDESLMYPAHLELLRSQLPLYEDEKEFAMLQSPLHKPALKQEATWGEIPVSNPLHKPVLKQEATWGEIPVSNTNNNNNNNNPQCAWLSSSSSTTSDASSATAERMSIFEFFTSDCGSDAANLQALHGFFC